jgi:uncharacterized protein (TIGR03067 family)
MMKRFLGIFLLASVPLINGAEDKAADTVAQELRKLQGTWLRTSFEFDGQEEDGDIKNAKIVVKGNTVTFFIGDKALGEATFSIDTTKSPKTMDSVAIRPNKGLKTVGIYEIVGDTLRTCTTTGDKRPEAFSTKEGSGHGLSVYERVKK